MAKRKGPKKPVKSGGRRKYTKPSVKRHGKLSKEALAHSY